MRLTVRAELQQPHLKRGKVFPETLFESLFEAGRVPRPFWSGRLSAPTRAAQDCALPYRQS